MASGFLEQAAVYLGAAVVCVPIAKRLGMGSVLGYLLAGILIGPFALGFIGQEGKDIMHFAEFGVVMMLFLVGLELEPAKFLSMRKLVLGVGGLQFVVTAGLVAGLGLVVGLSPATALTVGFAVAMSSTAIVLQTLKEKGQLDTSAGKFSFAVLLLQDVAVIPLLALLPLLADETTLPSQGGVSAESLPAWLQTLEVLGAVALIILAGRYAVVPLLRLVARTHLRELFVGCALLLVVGIALLMSSVGISPALGTFLAGVILANSEYKHELESDLEPFKGLLLGLFFLAVGASIDFQLIANQPGTIFGLTITLMVVKAVVLLGIGYAFRLTSGNRWLFALGMSQIGEFAFVLLSFSAQLKLIQASEMDMLLVITALSMALTPIILLVYDKLILPRMATPAASTRPDDTDIEGHRILIAGFGHYGSTLGRFLKANGIEATYLDNDSDWVDLIRQLGMKVYYGDATRKELLESAGAERAHILISTINNPEVNIRLKETVERYFPHLKLFFRVRNRYDAYELIDHGAQQVYRDGVESSLRIGVDVLKATGVRSYTARRAAERFFAYDEKQLHQLASLRHNKKEYFSAVRNKIAEQEEVLKLALQRGTEDHHDWDAEPLREAYGSR